MSAEYKIKGDQGFSDVGWFETPSSSDLSGVTPLMLDPDWTATISSPKRIYSAQGGYVETYSSGGTHYVHTKEFSPGTGEHLVYILGDTKIGIVAYSFPSSDHYVQRVLWIACDSVTDCINRVEDGRWGTDNVLYSELNADDSIPDFCVDNRDWDEAPSEDRENDPSNELPQGGEYADTMRFTETDLIGISDLPNPDADMHMGYGGLITCYLLDNTEMGNLTAGLFDTTFWSNLKQKFEGLSDPLSMILSAIQVPFKVTGTTGQFQIGNVVPEVGGNPVSCTRTATRYLKAGMGSITLKEVFGSEKDYSKVSIQIYLPYVGMKDLDPDVVVGNTLTLQCYADIWTGDVCYLLHVSNATAAKKYFVAETVPYRWTGNCAKQVPLGRVDNSRMIMNMVSTVATVGAGMATLGLGAVGATPSAVGAAEASQGAAASAAGGALKVGPDKSAMMLGASKAAQAISSAATSGFQPFVSSSGGVSGAAGQMDLQYAYIIVKRGVPKYPNGWRAQYGAPQWQMYSGTDCHGFTQFADIHIDMPQGASDSERIALENLLKTEGVIL